MSLVAGHHVLCAGFVGTLKKSVIVLIRTRADAASGMHGCGGLGEVMQEGINGNGVELELWPLEDLGVLFHNGRGIKKASPAWQEP